MRPPPSQGGALIYLSYADNGIRDRTCTDCREDPHAVIEYALQNGAESRATVV